MPFMEMEQNMNKKVEILSPAGSYESLKAAIAAGADAVYIGGTRFGARAYANNLTEEELLEAIDYVHLHGRKIYLTINTLLKEHELCNELYDYLLPYYSIINLSIFRCRATPCYRTIYHCQSNCG